MGSEVAVVPRATGPMGSEVAVVPRATGLTTLGREIRRRKYQICTTRLTCIVKVFLVLKIKCLFQCLYLIIYNNSTINREQQVQSGGALQ
jgi:hypothetical protein